MVYHYSSHAVAVGLAFSMEDESLTIFTPQLLDIPQYRPCLYLDVTVWVKPGLKQERFAIDSSTLDVIFEQNHTALAEEVLVSAVTGSVRSIPDVAEKAHWGGRDIHIITDASSIDGTFPLYDSLYLETKAGDINTDLTLHHGRDGLESEALLTLRSQAGSIRANTPLLRAVESGTGNATLESIPKRDYHTEVVTHAGKVDLKLVHGSHTAIDSAAGLIHAELTPWLDPQKESRIIAKTKAGDIKITIRDAIAYKDQALRNLFGDYHFIAGSLTLRYPAEWEGEVKGNLIAGSMNIDWPGLQILKRGREGLFNHFEARKGMGNANIIFEGVSGSALLLGKGGSRYPNTTHVMEDGDH